MLEPGERARSKGYISTTQLLAGHATGDPKSRRALHAYRPTGAALPVLDLTYAMGLWKLRVPPWRWSWRRE